MYVTRGFDLKAVLAGAADPNVQFQCAYRAVDRNGKVIKYGQDEIVGNGTTEVTILADPADDSDNEIEAYIIDSIHINNADNATATATVFMDDGTTNWVVFKAALVTLNVASFTPASGWKVLEADGGLAQQVA